MRCRSLSVPAAHPLKEFARANLVGVIVNREGRYLEYFITTYKYWLLEGLEAGSRANLENSLADMGLGMFPAFARGLWRVHCAAYDANTQEALDFGSFGSPSFSVGAEIFWGDDRLEDAIEFLGRTRRITANSWCKILAIVCRCCSVLQVVSA